MFNFPPFGNQEQSSKDIQCKTVLFCFFPILAETSSFADILDCSETKKTVKIIQPKDQQAAGQ